MLSGFDVHQQVIDAIAEPLEGSAPSSAHSSPRSSPRPPSIATSQHQSQRDDPPSAPASPAERIAAHIQAERSERNNGILQRLEEARVQLLRRIDRGEADVQLLHSLDEQITRAINNELQRPNSRGSRPSTAASARSNHPSVQCVSGLSFITECIDLPSQPKVVGRRPRSAIPQQGSSDRQRPATTVGVDAVLSGPLDTSDKAQAQASICGLQLGVCIEGCHPGASCCAVQGLQTSQEKLQSTRQEVC